MPPPTPHRAASRAARARRVEAAVVTRSCYSPGIPPHSVSLRAASRLPLRLLRREPSAGYRCARSAARRRATPLDLRRHVMPRPRPAPPSTRCRKSRRTAGNLLVRGEERLSHRSHPRFATGAARPTAARAACAEHRRIHGRVSDGREILQDARRNSDVRYGSNAPRHPRSSSAARAGVRARPPAPRRPTEGQAPDRTPVARPKARHPTEGPAPDRTPGAGGRMAA